MDKSVSSLIRKNIPKNSTVILAFSGGPDSVYLLHALKNEPYKIVLAHFNHKLRGRKSDSDEKFCKKIAKKLNLEFERDEYPIKKYAESNSLGIEEAARKKRYEFLEKVRKKHNAKAILTAHHADDNLETFLLNFMRGSGLKGLKSMQAKSGYLVRPLLYISKNDILAFLKKNRLKYRVDKSNKDIRYTRNNIRHLIIPNLKKIQPELLRVFIRNWEHLSQAHEYLHEKAKNWLLKNMKNDTEMSLKGFKNLHPIIQKSVIQELYQLINGNNEGFSSNMMVRAISFIHEKRTGKKMPFGKNFILTKTSKSIQCIPKNPPKNIKKAKLAIPGETAFRYGKITAKILKKSPENKKSAIFLDADTVNIPIYIRSKKSGDRFKPLGLKGTKKLQDFFVDNKVASFKRAMIPVFADAKGKIVAVGKENIADSCKITSKTKNIIKLNVKP
jgi:tRNA(Ile)-lysidine synthase